jgi:hypothetical protein
MSFMKFFITVFWIILGGFLLIAGFISSNTIMFIIGIAVLIGGIALSKKR